MFLESKYIALLSNRLRNFRRLSPDKFSFSCPYCNDSQRSKKKARGSVFPYKSNSRFNCFNCGKSGYTSQFIKDQDPYLHAQYLKDKLSQKVESYEPEKKEVKAIDRFVLSSLKSIHDLPLFHPAKEYVRSRLIPEKHWKDIYYCPKFKKWTNMIVPESFEDDSLDEPRLVLPFMDDQKVYAFQGRSFDPKSNLRYISITIDPNVQKIFGLQNVDFKKRHYILEGPIDSLFIDNSVAVGSSNLMSVSYDQSVYIFDNEPRNKEICSKIEKCIADGKSLVIWPKEFKWKDINAAAKEEFDYMGCIESNIYKGLEAKIKFANWRK